MKNSKNIYKNQKKSIGNDELQINNNAALCIAGMHRSGTSMITRMLNLSGLYLGQANQIMSAAPENPKGFWENIEFVRINDEILSLFGGRWDKIPQFPLNWFKADLLAPLREKANILIERINIFYPWGWKDPRNSITYPFWNRLLPDLKVIIPLRDPYEVALSLNARNGFPIEFGLSLWYEYNNALFTVTSSSQRIITHYDAYFDNAEAELKRLMTWLKWSTDEDQIKIAISSLTSNIRHHVAPLNRKQNYMKLKHVFELYEILLKDTGPYYQKLTEKSNTGKSNISCKASVYSDYKKRNSLEYLQQEHNSIKKGTLISIIIPVFNQLKLTIKCLAHIYKNTSSEMNFEIIIVDNASIDGTAEYLFQHQQSFANLYVIRNPLNKGFAKACNMGAGMAAGEYLLFLNNDTEPQPGWLEALAQVLDEDKKIGAVGAKLLFPDGTIQHAGVAIVNDKKLPDPLVARHIFYRQSADFPEANSLKTYQALTAAALLIRKTAFFQVDGFDENYWNGYEDVDLCFKLREKDWLLVYQPKSVIIHYESQSGRERFTGVPENIKRLHDKWLKKIAPDFLITLHGEIKKLPQSQIKNYKLEKHRKIDEPEPIDVSIIILTYNQLSFTKECLQSIEKYTKKIKYEVIIVDNASTDGTPEYLKSIRKSNANYKIILNSENLGYAGGNNLGIREANGKYILLLNNDVVVTKDWLAQMVSRLEEFPELGLVGPMSNYVSGPQLVKDANYRTSEGLQSYAKKRAHNFAGKIVSTSRLVGFCLLIRRDVFSHIGLLDERFGKGNFEDDDFCLRAGLAGYKMAYAKDVFIHHYGSQSFSGNNINYQESIRKNNRIFIEKWKDCSIPHAILIAHLLEKSQFDEANGDLQNAISAVEKAYTLAPLDAKIHLRYIDLLSKSQNNQKYVDILENYLRKHPSDPQALNRMGIVYWAQNKIMEARHYFEQAVVNDGDHPEHLKNLADAYLAEEKFEEGIQILMALMQKFPDDFEAFEKMANLYIENGNYDSARELIERFREKQPGHAYAGSMLELIQYPEVYIAYQFLNQGELDTAENLFRDYLTHTPDCLPAKLGLGSIIFHKEQYKEAEKIYAEILNSGPENEEALLYMAKIKLAGETTGEFEELYSRHEKLFAASPLLKRTYIEYLIQKDSINQAAEEIQHLLNENPGDLEIHILAGNLFYRQGKYEEAEKMFRNALTIDPANEIAKENLQVVLNEMIQ